MKNYFLILVLILFSFPITGLSKLTVDINRGKVEKLKIILNECNTDVTLPISASIVKLVKKNLLSSGVFEVIEQSSYCDLKDFSASTLPIKQEVIGLVTLNIFKNSKENLKYELKGWDTLTKKVLFDKVITTTSTEENQRKAAHLFSDIIYSSLTGEQGYFNTKIGFISQYGNNKQIMVMDQDGHNSNFITKPLNINSAPSFSPDGKKIAYMDYIDNQGRVYLLDTQSNTTKEVGSFSAGMTSAPRFAPKSDKILLAHSLNHTTNLYLIDLKSNIRKKLTTNNSINTSASFSPDEKKIVFNSDRGGSPQLYIMNTDGNSQKKISQAEGNYFAPLWSPRGDLITFIKTYRGKAYVGIMKPDGTGERLLTTGNNFIEGVSWAPNGRRVIYSKQIKERFYLFSIDITGSNERMIPTPYSSTAPSWSSVLPTNTKTI